VLSWCTLWHFSRENLLMANQPLLRNRPRKLNTKFGKIMQNTQTPRFLVVELMFIDDDASRHRERWASSSRMRRLSLSATTMLPWLRVNGDVRTVRISLASGGRRETPKRRSISPPVLTSATCHRFSCTLLRPTINVPVGDSTLCSILPRGPVVEMLQESSLSKAILL